MTKDISHSVRSKVLDAPLPLPLPTLVDAVEEVRLSVDRFCLLAGIGALQEMMEEDAATVCGARRQERAIVKRRRQSERSGRGERARGDAAPRSPFHAQERPTPTYASGNDAPSTLLALPHPFRQRQPL